MPLSSLPMELLLDVIDRLPAPDKVVLGQASREFRQLVRPLLSSHDMHEYYASLETRDPDRLRRMCSVCHKLKRFYHFSLRQGRPSTSAPVRTCLFCHADRLRYALPNQMPRTVRWLMGQKVGLCSCCNHLVMCAPNGHPRPHRAAGRSQCHAVVWSAEDIVSPEAGSQHAMHDFAAWTRYRDTLLPVQPSVLVLGLLDRLDRRPRADVLALKNTRAHSYRSEVDPINAFLLALEAGDPGGAVGGDDDAVLERFPALRDSERPPAPLAPSTL